MSSSQYSILLLEDNRVLANLIRLKLSQSGYDVRVESDGADGYAAINEDTPDLVLLDMMLPTMTGFEVLQQLSDDGYLPGLPVIIISNSGEPVEIERARKLGVADHLVKVHFSPSDVLHKVNGVLQGA